ncbi:MAG: hypothetical protein HOP03_00025 [Lysobacter sp.]|nr:hypothetical protein [Lysobacter sp.]
MASLKLTGMRAILAPIRRVRRGLTPALACEGEMEHWSPLLQTILWVGLIGGIAYRFQKPIHGLLEALTERIKAGSDVTAGPFSVKSMQSLPPPEQAARANKEIAEANEVAHALALPEPQDEVQPITAPAQTPTPTPEFRAQHFQAEDLALRAVQAEFGQPISRQVTGGHDEGFDGAFVLNNRLNIVEIKYVSKSPPKALLQQALHRLQSYVASNNWKSVNIVLVAVVDRTTDIEPTLKRLTAVADESAVPTVARVYALSELQAKFGIVDAG